MNGLTCWNCGAEGKHDPIFEEDNLYVCTECGEVNGYYCKGCDRVYTKNRLIEWNGAWVCKECDKPQWGYTLYKRNKRGEMK